MTTEKKEEGSEAAAGEKSPFENQTKIPERRANDLLTNSAYRLGGE